MMYSVVSLYNGKLYSQHSTYEAAEEALHALRHEMSPTDYDYYEPYIEGEQINENL